MVASISFTQVRNDVSAFVFGAWNQDNCPTASMELLYWDSVKQPIQASGPGAPPSYGRLLVQHATGGQRGFSSGSKAFSRTGIISVQIYTPFGDGQNYADQCATHILDAFETGTTDQGIWFRNPRMRELGPNTDIEEGGTRKHFVTEILAEFFYENYATKETDTS